MHKYNKLYSVRNKVNVTHVNTYKTVDIYNCLTYSLTTLLNLVTMDQLVTSLNLIVLPTDYLVTCVPGLVTTLIRYFCEYDLWQRMLDRKEFDRLKGSGSKWLIHG
jgi:hypothetical protein